MLLGAHLRARRLDAAVIAALAGLESLEHSTPIEPGAPAPPGPAVPFAELWHRISVGAVDGLDVPDVGVARDLTDDLVRRLAVAGEATLWREFDARRTPGGIVLASLADPPPREIYCGFLEELRADGLRWLTERYPVLGRHLETIVAQWREASAELLARVGADRRLLGERFDLPADARLAGARSGMSDPHRGGRTVALLSFVSSSGTHRVVYKPKELHVDRALQQLLAELELHSVEVLPRDGYGYMQYVEHRPCTSETELAAFHRNAGRLAAVLLLLGCTDCHFENLIADGEQLVLVDAETLFEGVTGPPARSALHERMSRSVLRLGLLPQWQVAGQQRLARDASALGLEPPRHPRQRVPGWLALNTDAMLAGQVEQDAPAPASLPVTTGSPNRLPDFVDELCDGVEQQLRAVAERREHWLDEQRGPLARFRAQRRRFVRRPTWLYLSLRRQLLQPDALVSEAAQEEVLAELTHPRLVAATDERSRPLFAREAAQLRRLDVPFFEQLVDGRDVLAPDGSTIPGYFRVSGYAHARTRLLELDEDSIALQLRLIRGVVAAKQLRAHRRSAVRRSAATEPPALTGADRLREAVELGDRLVDDAITDPGGALEWLAIDAAEDIDLSSYGPLGPSLYSGRAGIALFLSTLARRGTARATAYRTTALGACADLVRTPDDAAAWWREQPLGLAGSGGLLLALTLLGELTAELRDGLLGALDVELLRSDDVIFGCAGLIGPLLRIRTPKSLELARAAGDALVGRQDTSGGWLDPAIGPRPLTGFSHGASGAAAALTRLYAETGESRYLESAARALRYERELLDSAEGNWPDLRQEGRAFMVSWCHGAPGIALARLCLRGSPLWDAEAEAELDLALDTTAASLGGDSVCCGRLGGAAILRLAAAPTGRSHWADAAARHEAGTVAEKRVAGGFAFTDVPGLFQGAAGAGLALLDVDAPDPLLPVILSAGLLS